MADALLRQICKVCGRVRHQNGDGSWGSWHESKRNRRLRESSETAELVECGLSDCSKIHQKSC